MERVFGLGSVSLLWEPSLGRLIGDQCARVSIRFCLAGLFCLCSGLWAFASSSDPASLHFECISSENGLSHDSVYGVVQDQIGFLWVATEDGLNAYDGKRFRVYRPEPENPHSISHTSISTLAKHPDGRLLVGTWGGGLNVFDPVTGQFQVFQPGDGRPQTVTDSRIQVLLPRPDGKVWIGCFQNGLDLWDPSDNSFTNYRFNADNPNTITYGRIWSLAHGENGKLWVGTQNGLNLLDPETGIAKRYFQTPKALPSANRSVARCLLRDSGMRLWLGTEAGLFMKSSDSETFHRIPIPESNSQRILSLFEPEPGIVWVAAINHLYCIDGKTGKVIQDFSTDPVINETFTSSDIRDFYLDRTQVLWMGSRGGGIYKVDLKPRKFEYMGWELEGGLSGNRVSTIMEDQKGDIWVGTNGGGITRIKKEFEAIGSDAFEYITVANSDLKVDFVRVLMEDRHGRIWIGTWWDGLQVLDPTSGDFQEFHFEVDSENGLMGSRVNTIYEDRGGDIWVGTVGGLNRYLPDTQGFEVFRPDPENDASLSDSIVLSVLEDAFGYLWVGTDFGGVCRMDLRRREFRSYQSDNGSAEGLPSNRVWTIFEDRDRVLWLGTGNGLCRYDRAGDHFQVYGLEQGLPSAVINGITEDRRGRLWVSTNRGISVFDEENDTFRNYGPDDGLQGNVFNHQAALCDSRGRIWFGGNNGLNHFRADALQPSTYKPNVVLTGVTIMGKAVDTEKPIWMTGEFALDYEDKLVMFEYAALDFTRPERNLYAYKLEGFDEAWQQTGNRNFATFSGLPAGKYRLLVRAANSDGVWGSADLDLDLRIFPPPWKTWWAYSLYALALLAASYWFARRKNLAHARAMARKERAILQEQEIAARLKAMNDSLSREVTERTRAEAVQSALFKISEISASSETVDEFYQSIGRVVRDLLKAENFYIALYDDDTGMIRYPHWVNTCKEKPTPRQFGKGLSELLVRRGRPVLLREQEVIDLVESGEVDIPDPKPLCWIGAPLLSDTRTLGALAVSSYAQDNIYQESDLEVLGFVSRHIATALERQALEEESKKAHEIALASAQDRGKMQFADSVLHNIGNVLSSLRTSSTELNQLLGRSRTQNLIKALEMIPVEPEAAVAFFSEDEKGKLILPYLRDMSRILEKERLQLATEGEQLLYKVNLISELVTTQQSLAKGRTVMEKVRPLDVLEEALNIQQGTLHRYAVTVRHDISGELVVEACRGNLLHVFINLVKNAAESMSAISPESRVLEVRVEDEGDEDVTLVFEDRGVGIGSEHIQHIFEHGFTTKKHGHGFGLPFCKSAMLEMEGDIVAESDGPGEGTRFLINCKREAVACSREAAS